MDKVSSTAVANATDGNFRLLVPARALEFTGERMTTAIEGQIEFEHFHRYCLARDLCLGLDVLDVACGEGYGSNILAGVARSVTGVDIDEGAVEHAREAYRLDNLLFLRGNATDLPVETESVDAVVSFETLEHIRDHDRFAAEVKRVLRPGGMFIVSTPDRAVYSARGEHFNEFHLLELAEQEFKSFLRANFAQVRMLRQRAVVGSVIVGADLAGPWRSYERRAPEYIEASSGLSRAPYLIGVASDSVIPAVASSAYLDRRGVEEVVGSFARGASVELQAETDLASARAALAEAVAATRIAESEREEVSRRLAEAVAATRIAESEREEVSRAFEHATAENARSISALQESNGKLVRRIEDLRKAISATNSETAALLQDLWRTSEDKVRRLAGLTRPDYDGGVPKRLGGIRLLFRRRAKDLRRLATDYRIVAGSPLFDAQWYLTSNPDVAEAKSDPVLHYLLHGYREGRSPGPHFSGAEYQRANPDVLGSGANPLIHYILYGRKEARRTLVPRELIIEVPTYSVPLQGSFRSRDPSYRPLVSVIVPNYNHRDYLTERINSILHQTYTNIEIILLDDNSTDGSQQLLKEYRDRYPERIRLLLNDTNSGNVFSQWKKGFDLAAGTLIWICESDDYCERNFLEHIVPYFEDLSVNIAFGRVQYITRDGRIQSGLDSYREGAEAGIWEEEVRRPAHKWFCRGFGVNNVIPNVGGSVWRGQALLDRVWSEAQTANVVGDWFLYCHLSGGGQIVYVPAAVSYFRQHDSNISVVSFKTEKYYLEHQWLLLTLRRFWGVPESTVNAFTEKLLYQYRHYNTDGNMRSFDQLFDTELIVRTRRSKPHILIASLGFRIGGGEVFPIHLANSLRRAGHVVSMFALDMTDVNQGLLATLAPGIAIYSKKDVLDGGIDRFLSEAGVSIIHSHMISVDAFFFNEARLGTKIPYLVSLHGSYEACPLDDGTFLRIIRGVSHWVYTAEKNLEVFRPIPLESGIFSKLENAMPFDPRPFERTRKELGISSDAVVFTLVARGIEKKGWEESLLAFTGLRSENPGQKMHLLLCGEGEVTSKLTKSYSSDPDITFLGNQSRINGLYGISDCAIVPTRFAGESFPLCIIQAMQVGTPIIATRMGEIEHMITRPAGLAGILIEPTDDTDKFVMSLKDAMQIILQRSVRDIFAKTAKLIGGEYDIDLLAEKYCDLYQRLIKAG